MKKLILITLALFSQAFVAEGGPAVSSGKRILFEVRCIDKMNAGVALTLTSCQPTPAPNGILLKTCDASFKANQFKANYFVSHLPQAQFQNLVIATNNGQVNVMATEVNSTIKGMKQFLGKMSYPGLPVREVPVDCYVNSSVL